MKHTFYYFFTQSVSGKEFWKRIIKYITFKQTAQKFKLTDKIDPDE